MSSSNSSCGTEVGILHAPGTLERKRVALLREMASASSLCAPGICSATNVNLKWASMKNKQRSMCMRVSSLQLRCFMTCTADSLSDLVRMCFPLQSWPHTMHEAMIRIISFTAMDWESSTVYNPAQSFEFFLATDDGGHVCH